MLEKLVPHRWVLEPFVGALFFALWLCTQFAQGAQGTATIVVSCAAIALSRVSPATALGVGWLAIILDVIDTTSVAARDQWVVYLAFVVIVFGAAAHGRAVTRWLTLATAVLIGPIGAVVLFASGVLDLPGLASEPVLGGAFLLLAIVLAIGQAAAWLIGYVVARQRQEQKPAGASVLVWLAQSSGARNPALPAESLTFVRRLSTSQLVIDILLAVALFLISVAAEVGQSSHPLVALTGLVGFALALALRRLAPTVALGLAWFAAIVQMLSGVGPQWEDVAILFVLYATAAYGDRVTRWAGLVSAGVGAIVAALFLTMTEGLAAFYYDAFSSAIARLALQFVFILGVSVTVLGLSWVLGLLARTWRNARASRRAQAMAEEEQYLAQQSVVIEQERNRIARDMHDVVAHSLAVVIAQADGARYARAVDPNAVDEALVTISATAREALGDVRLLLGELRHSEAVGPQPSLEDLTRLLDQMRKAGLPIDLVETGIALKLGSGHQIALYRIVQEALTNALRHGDVSRTAVLSLAWMTNGVTVTVTNTIAAEEKNMPVITPIAASRLGHGLPGMRERALLSGGWLTAEPKGEQFTVRVFLPAPVAARPESARPEGGVPGSVDGSVPGGSGIVAAEA